VSQKSIHRSLQ